MKSPDHTLNPKKRKKQVVVVPRVIKLRYGEHIVDPTGSPQVESVQLNQALNKTRWGKDGYVATQKLDGVRASWDGKFLKSRAGKDLKAPGNLVHGLPQHNGTLLVGELMASKGQNDALRGLASADKTTAHKTHNDQKTRFFLFDSFSKQHLARPYSQRLSALERIVKKAQNPRLGVVKTVKRENSSDGFSGKDIQKLRNSTDEGWVLTPEMGPPTSKRIKVKNYKKGKATILATSHHKFFVSIEAYLEPSKKSLPRQPQRQERVNLNIPTNSSVDLTPGSSLNILYRTRKNDRTIKDVRLFED